MTKTMKKTFFTVKNICSAILKTIIGTCVQAKHFKTMIILRVFFTLKSNILKEANKTIQCRNKEVILLSNHTQVPANMHRRCQITNILRTVVC